MTIQMARNPPLPQHRKHALLRRQSKPLLTTLRSSAANDKLFTACSFPRLGSLRLQGPRVKLDSLSPLLAACPQLRRLLLLRIQLEHTNPPKLQTSGNISELGLSIPGDLTRNVHELEPFLSAFPKLRWLDTAVPRPVEAIVHFISFLRERNLPELTQLSLRRFEYNLDDAVDGGHEDDEEDDFDGPAPSLMNRCRQTRNIVLSRPLLSAVECSTVLTDSAHRQFLTNGCGS